MPFTSCKDMLFICCNTIYRKKSNVHLIGKYVRFFSVLLCMASQTAYFSSLNMLFYDNIGVSALHIYVPYGITACHHARYGCTRILAIFRALLLFVCKYRKYEGFGFFNVKAKRPYRLHLCYADIGWTIKKEKMRLSTNLLPTYYIRLSYNTMSLI